MHLHFIILLFITFYHLMSVLLTQSIINFTIVHYYGDIKMDFSALIKVDIFIVMKQDSGKSSVIKFENTPIKNCRIYALHRAYINGQQRFVKVFNNQIIAKYALDETLEFNVEVLTESPNFVFQQNFLHIQATHNQQNALIFITKPYETRLDQFLKGNPLNQKQALVIFQDILKAVYSFIMEGFWHRNLRAQHFVKVGNKWKLQTIVYEQKIPPEGTNSQFLYNAQYQPPQAYQRPNFTDAEFDQRIVWDLGCILIHMLTGFHKLKNQAVLSKFEKQSFSFGKIAGNLQSKLSKQLIQMLARMCHYNQKQRMTIDELILNGFFSKQIAEHYKKHKESKKKGMWTSSSQSISKSLRGSNNGKIPDIGAAKQIADNLKKSAQRQDKLLSSSNGGDKLTTKKQFEEKIFSIIQDDDENQISSRMNGPKKQKENKIEKLQSFDQIKNEQLDEILDVYKNYIDKGDILGIGSKKFDQMLILFEDKKLGRELGDLTQYALNFVKAMFICKLATAMNENKSFFDFNGRTWEKFHGSQQYQSIKKIVNFKRKQAMNEVFLLKQKLTNSINRFKDQKPTINNFVTRSKPQQSDFVDIKQPYRKILKLSYDKIAEHYTTNKTQEWARLGMYITYCLAIDKFYIPEEFKNNFEYFFKWSKKTPTNYVPLFEFQQYLDNAPRIDLVQNSRYIMKKFFEI